MMPKHLLTLLLLVLLFPSVSSGGAVQVVPPTIPGSFRSSPVMFIENVGQWDSDARFLVRGGNSTMWLAEDAIWLTVVEGPVDDTAGAHVDTLEPFDAERAIVGREHAQRKAANIKLTFANANPHPRLEPFDRLNTVVSYFIGNEPEKWRPDVPVWGGVRYVDLYPGVDLELVGEEGRWTWKLIGREVPPLTLLKPSSSQTVQALQVDGATGLSVDRSTLRIDMDTNEALLPLLRLDGTEGEAVGPPRVSGNLVLSPFTRDYPEALEAGRSFWEAGSSSDLLYGTFLGGGDVDDVQHIVVDGEGNAYVVGESSSPDFPVTPGVYGPVLSGSDYDIVVAKLNANGTDLLFATFVGGAGGGEHGVGIALDGAGTSYVTGYTNAADFPTTPNAFDRTLNGPADAVVTKLNGTGTALIYSTLLGGSNGDYGNGIAADEQGTVYVTGSTLSDNFPVTPGAFRPRTDGHYGDAFVTKLRTTGPELDYSTCLGGYDVDTASAVAVDQAGSAYIVGWTLSPDFPTTSAAFDRSCGSDAGCNHDGYTRLSDAFVVKLDAKGSSLGYSTFLGGRDRDFAYGVAIAADGSADVVGETSSSDFPTTPGAFDRTCGSDGQCDPYSPGYPRPDGFVARLSATGSTLSFGAFLGGRESDASLDIAADAEGNRYVTGRTGSEDFPTTPNAFDSELNGVDVFAVKLAAPDLSISYGTFLGGSTGEYGTSIAVDDEQTARIVGWTNSPDFPTTAGAFDTACGINGKCSRGSNEGGIDGYVVRLAMGRQSPPPTPTATPTPSPLPAPRLVYTGPLYLPASPVVRDEADARISLGDHVHLVLPFRNNGGAPLTDATVTLEGQRDLGVLPTVRVHAGLGWGQRVIARLTPSTVLPGQAAQADVWIHVDDIEPLYWRTSLGTHTWLKVITSTGEWQLTIAVSPVRFVAPEHADMLAMSCLHSPENFDIQVYAQHAASAIDVRTPPDNAADPDTPEQAVRNVVHRVHAEFQGSLIREPRQIDWVLLQRRWGAIGSCRHYTDLTIGLLRSLGLPARFVGTDMRMANPAGSTDGHAWAEAHLDGRGWLQADATWDAAIDQQGIYEESAIIETVVQARADRYPLSTAASTNNDNHRCVEPCYEDPIDCAACLDLSNRWLIPRVPTLSCVEDVTQIYHQAGARQGVNVVQDAGAGLTISIAALSAATVSQSLSVETTITNTGAAATGPLQAAIASSLDVLDAAASFSVSPGAQLRPDLAPGQAVTLTWTVQPLVAGAPLLLRASAYTGDQYAIAEWPLAVTASGQSPALMLGGVCASGGPAASEPITLTATVYDHLDRPLTGDGTLVTAEVSAQAAPGFTTTLALPYCSACGAFRGALRLPDDAALGAYTVRFHATHAEFAPAEAETAFYHPPALALSMATLPASLSYGQQLTLTLHATEIRGETELPVSGAGAWAVLASGDSAVTVPLAAGEPGTYQASLDVAGLSAELGHAPAPDPWTVRAYVDYLGKLATTEAAVSLHQGTYLPLILQR